MKKIIEILLLLACVLAIVSLQACGNDEPEEPGKPGTEEPDRPADPDGDVLVAYFSWGGTTERMAQIIADRTGADIFEIEPEVPYPTEYTPTT